MNEQLIGSWKHEGEHDGTRTETTIAIGGDGKFVTRMDYQMPGSRQIVEHHGMLEVEDEWFRVILARGCTQEFPMDGSGGPLREFTQAEFEETSAMLSQRISYQFTADGHLETKVMGPNGLMTIVYIRCPFQA